MMKKAYAGTLREILEYEKYEVDDAADGSAGIELLKRTSMMLFFAISKCPRWMALKCWSK